MEHTLQKMQPFQRRAIMFVDTLGDTTGVVQRIQELGLKAYITHDISDIADKERCPHFDTIVVDSLTMVCCVNFSPCSCDFDLVLHRRKV